MSDLIPNGTAVVVEEVTSAGKPRTPYTGVVQGNRKGVGGMFTVQYLIRADATGHERYVYERYVTPVVTEED